MRTLLPDPPPAPFDELLEQRRRWGGDRFDEVWDGVLHMNPSPHRRHAYLQAQLIEVLAPLGRARGLRTVGEFNLGVREDFRVPDAALHRPGPDELYNATAALVIEIISANDETWEKLGFYAAHGVQELLIIDPQQRQLHWLALAGEGYEPVERSGLVDLGSAELAERIDWPPVEE
ncbi:MAG: Uma2 family endonuclease [Actinomycetota bacterium]|nr:Uma2 family endonuclease [Actinomycetota bacterium]